MWAALNLVSNAKAQKRKERQVKNQMNAFANFASLRLCVGNLFLNV